MVNLGIFALLAAAFLLTRKREGTTKLDGLASGLTIVRLGQRFGVLVFAYRPNRVYWKLEMVEG